MFEIGREMIIYLFAAHIIGDFLFQIKSDVQNKSKPLILVKHSLVITLLTYVILGVWNLWYVALIIGATHFIIDSIKARYDQKIIFPFIIDQLAHLLILLIAASFLTTHQDSLSFFGAIYLVVGIYSL